MLASDREDWHDVGVVELGRCMRLDAEALQSERVDRRGPREDFERNPAPERDLKCLVDDPHPSAADLTHEPILAENRIRRQCILSRLYAAAAAMADAAADCTNSTKSNQSASASAISGLDRSNCSRDGCRPASKSARYAASTEAIRGSSSGPSRSAGTDAAGLASP